MKDKPCLSIIIVNWNVGSLIKKCLESIYATVKRHDFEIIVVDNRSSDNSIEIIETYFKDVILIRNISNVGFAIANNQGIRIAQGAYILLLNPDTIVCKDAIDTMIDVLKIRPDVGLVGPRTLNEDGSIQIDCNRGFPNLIDCSRKLFLNERIADFLTIKHFKFSKYYKDNYATNIQGACMLFRRSVIDKIGMFDEVYSMYLDDMDICYRTFKSGYKIFYVSSAVIYHLKRRSTKQLIDSKKKEVMIHVAINIFFKKHYGIAYAMLHRLLLFLGSVFRITTLGVLLTFFLPVNKERANTLLEVLLKYILLMRYCVTGNNNIISLASGDADR